MVVGATRGWHGEYTSTEWTGVEKHGVASQFYGLGTMNIAPLHGRIDLTTRVQVPSLGKILGRSQAPKTVRPLGRLPLIVSYVLILLKAHPILHSKSHTHQHTSKHTTWHFISILTYIYHANQPTLAYIYHGCHHKPQHASIMAIFSNLTYIYHVCHIISSKATNK